MTGRLALDFIGHSSVVVGLDGVRLLTDPVTRARVGPLRRVQPVPDRERLRDIDAVLISHLHWDHLDVPSLRDLGRDTAIIVPAGAGPWLRGVGFRDVRELAVGGETSVGGVVVRGVPAVHSGYRPPLGPTAPPLGFVVRGSRTVYFAGDTDLFDGMGQLGEPIDLALLPVWGWGPRLGTGSPPRPVAGGAGAAPAPAARGDADPLGDILAARARAGLPGTAHRTAGRVRGVRRRARPGREDDPDSGRRCDGVGTVTDDVTRPFDTRPTGPAPSDAPPIPAPQPPSSPDLRGGLERLSRGLIVYGVVGLVVAGLGLGVLAYVNSRLDAAGDRVETSMEQLATTVDRTAKALHDASATAQTFSVTLDRTSEAVSAAADTIIGVRTNLETLESVLRTVNILGVSPLGTAADAVGGIANSIEGLDSRLTGIADSLEANHDALAANATSLGQARRQH